LNITAQIGEDISNNVNKSCLLEKGIWSVIHDYKNMKYQPSRPQLYKLKSRLPGSLSNEPSEVMDCLLNRDYFLERIKSITEFYYEGYVYDLYVPNAHNFTCEGVIVHNCVDEFDKMEATDRAAMHEAMEQQSVSIAKAGMLATFRARCSVLAAANPKYGRFDNYRPISDQVNLSPTILSRFDLIFFVRDELEDTKEVAKHILHTATSPKAITPHVPPDFLKKYIAYARQNCFPVLTEEARNRIEEFYIDMRESAKDTEGIPIPLTARQLWAIIRLARASSRVRLSDKTTVEDVDRAIRLVKISLQQAGFDLETGAVDIDKIMVGVTRAQRDRLTRVLDIIKELEKELNAPVKKSEIIEMGLKEGITKNEIEKAIEKLKSDGYIYDPRRNERYKVV
jgi:replicative DNA helicase Mcm